MTKYGLAGLCVAAAAVGMLAGQPHWGYFIALAIGVVLFG